jgi:hypothetical protein
MWTALGVAAVASLMAVLSFLSRGKALKRVGALEAQIEEFEDLVAGSSG